MEFMKFDPTKETHLFLYITSIMKSTVTNMNIIYIQ